MSRFTLTDLEQRIADRAAASAELSYTRKLLDKGAAQCAKKFGEEAVEAALAAVSGNAETLTAETADVLYHLLVMLEAAGVGLDAVMAELQRRTSRGGLAEKAARSTAGGDG